MENLDPQVRPSTLESTPPEINSYLPLQASVTADLLHAATCPHCGRRPSAAPAIAPFGLLVSLARLVIAIGAAVSLLAIIVSLFRWGMYRFIAGELWALFATFVVSVGVLLLYEIRDLLRQGVALPQAGSVLPNRRAATASTINSLASPWHAIGAFGTLVWLPFQSQRDRQLIGHLTFDERQELLHRLATVMVCIAATTIAPVLIAFAFLSPLAVCIAATAIASNLFVLDWFKKRHKQWLNSTTYAREHPACVQTGHSETTEFFGTTDGTDGHG